VRNLFISGKIFLKKYPSETTKSALKSVRLEVIRGLKTSTKNSAVANSHIEVSLQVTGKSPYLKAEAHGLRHLIYNVKCKVHPKTCHEGPGGGVEV